MQRYILAAGLGLWLTATACAQKQIAETTPAHKSPIETSAETSAAKMTAQILSPNGQLKAEIKLDGAAGLHYRVLDEAHDNKEIIGWSALGLVTSKITPDHPDEKIISDFTQSLSLIGKSERRVTDSYEMLTGKRRRNEYSARELILNLQDDETGQKLNVELHIANDGIALRYVLPEVSPLYHWIEQDIMEFNLGLGGRHWGQAYDFPTLWKPAYETPFINGQPIGTNTPPESGTGWGFPSLFEDEDGRWILLSETGLSRDYHGSHLEPKASGGIYRLAPPLKEAGMGVGRPFSTSTLPLDMPWRFILISRDLGDIAESNRVFDLAPPRARDDIDWIKPGLVSWSWWSDHDSSRDAQAMKPFIDLAADMGWPYSLIDANWNLISETALEELTAYGREKGVDLLFWYNSGGAHNFVTEEPRNLMDARSVRRAEFARLQAAGAKGIKVDFFHSDNQDRITQYIDILEDAADFNLLVNFHGSTIPRGWQRTYPHLMTMESVRGGEVYTFPSEPDYGVLATYQNTILPFTRNVIGSMDYTPVDFSNQTVRHLTSYAHEAALGVMFESGLQHLSDSVESYKSMSEDYTNYLKQLPAVWDDTKLLSGYPGQYAVMARRKNGRWYIAGINGEDKPKTLTLDLSALGGFTKNGILLYDAAEPFKFTSKPMTLEAASLEVTMGPYGGFVFVPQ